MTSRIASARYSEGKYATGRALIEYLDRLPIPAGLRPVQICHGVNNGPDVFNYIPRAGVLMEALIETGRYLPFAADQGGQAQYADSTVAPDIAAAYTFYENRYATRSDKRAFVASSMGFLNMAQEVYAHSSKYVAGVGLCPLAHGAHGYADTSAGIQALMDASAVRDGAANWAAVDTARSPYQRPSDFANMHLEVWQGTSDAVIRPTDTSTFAAAVAHGTYHAIGGAHVDTTFWTNLDIPGVIAALDAGDWS